MLSSEDLAKLHKVNLEMLKEVHRICEKYKIRYFLYFGTLLGAVRHNGFIPWDDDSDVVIFYEDRKRFVDACKKELSDRFSFKEFYYNGRICLFAEKTKTIDEKNLMQKISIDIFYINHYPENKILNKITMYVNSFFIFTYLLKRYKNPIKYQTFIGKIFSPFIFIASYMPYTLLTYMYKILTCFKYLSSKEKHFCYSFLPERIVKNPEAYCIDYSLKLCLHKFEDTEFYIPEDYHKYLSTLYGDYMVPPPDIENNTDNWEVRNSGRAGHGFVFVDFGDWFE